MSRSFFFLFFALSLLVLPASNSIAQPSATYKIAAVVNDDIVSMLEVEDRMRFVMATTGLSNTAEVRARMVPQIVRSLIDEKLQLQAAASHNITIPPNAIAGAIATIEKQRGRPPGSLIAYLERSGVPAHTFKQQLQAQLSWNQLINRKVSSSMRVSEDELMREMERARHQQANAAQEVNISSILLPVDRPENEANVQSLAQKLVSEIRGGASFEAIASQFSTASGTNANRLWVPVKQLDPVLASAVTQLEGAGLLDPVRTATGYHIIRVHESRQRKMAADPELLFKEIIMSLKTDAAMREVDILMEIARSVGRHPGACHQKGIAGIEELDDFNIQVSHTRTRFSAMSPELRPLVEGLELEEVSEPFAAPDGIHMLMLCEKVVKDGTNIDIEQLRKQVMSEKFRLEAMRQLRNLRRQAFVEVRI